MEKPLITIVVPVYNIENYLAKCVDSIMQQSYDDIDIILVNDGSTDSSGVLCDRFSDKDHRIRVIHKENGGLSDARNRGIDEAKGDYITFVDGDDFLDKEYVTSLYSCLKDNRADISVCEFCYMTETGKVLNHPMNDNAIIKYNQREALSVLLMQKPFSNSACGKLFKRCDFDDVRFPIGRIYEDTATIYKLFMKANIVAFVARAQYNYIRHNNSISKGAFKINQIDSMIFAEEMTECIEKSYPDLSGLCKCRLMDSYIGLIQKMPREKYAETYNEIWRKIRMIRKEVLFSKEASRKRKLWAFLSYFGSSVLVKAINIYESRIK